MQSAFTDVRFTALSFKVSLLNRFKFRKDEKIRINNFVEALTVKSLAANVIRKDPQATSKGILADHNKTISDMRKILK